MPKLRRVLLLGCILGSVGVWFGLCWLEEFYDAPYNRVENGLYIGSSVDKPPRGTQAVVNLCGRKDPYEVEASLWLPIFEGGVEPNLAWLGQVVEFIAKQREAGRITYVHCFSGMNRSGAAVAAYLMYEHRWGRDEAVRFVQARRSVVQPNPTLMRLLTEWERSLQ